MTMLKNDPFAILNEKYDAFSHYNTKINEQFMEFSLEELGFPTADFLLDKTLNIVNEIGGIKGWLKNNNVSNKYRGFSLCYNPDGDEHLRSPYASLGHPELNWSYSKSNNPNPPWKEVKNTYYDTYGFNTVHPVVKKHYAKFFECIDLMPTRSRVMWESPGHKQKWHLDEVLWQCVRINIPLVTEPSYVLQIDGTDEYGNTLKLEKHLEVGKAYVWNTRIRHRVLDIGDAKNERVHIVAAFMTWFKKENNHWKTNKYFGVQPFDMVKSKLIFPYAI